MGKDFMSHSYKEYIQMYNEHMKRCLTSLETREMQIKTKIRYYFIPTRPWVIKKDR